MSERSWKDKVVMWNEGGISTAEIVKRCEQIGKKVSKSKVLRLLKKTYVVRKPYTPSSIIDKEKIQPIFKYIFDAFMSESQEDEEKIVKEIQAQFGETITPTIVKRIREAQGIGTDHVRYGHSVRMVNRPPRVAFCTHHLSVGTMFTRHAFTDESMVQSGKRGRFCFVLKGDTSRRIKPKFKHPPQLMIWGGVSWEGATPLVVMRNKVRVDGGVYQSMLHSTYLKWAEKKFGGNVVLVQDNAACHTSESTQAFFKRSGVQTLDWPAESPDLNPVEMAWAIMKQWLKKHKKENTLAALEEGIREWWKTKLTKTLCRKLILRMQKQMRVIEKQGEPVYD